MLSKLAEHSSCCSAADPMLQSAATLESLPQQKCMTVQRGFYSSQKRCPLASQVSHTATNIVGSSSDSPLCKFMPKNAGSIVVAMTLMFNMLSQRLTMMMWLRLLSSCMCHRALKDSTNST
eukprot:GHUV01031651.1.p2 GENE.GHUV01031651.1~~GHUV01031651.1.p2  ORF type:complete len:121 (-),score=31.08 GHUV01031651.1:436-798(-)